MVNTFIKSDFFDPEFYLDIYDDIKINNIDPYEHYMQNGYKEGRFPFPCKKNELKNLIVYCKDNNINFINKIEDIKKNNPKLYDLYNIWRKIDKKNYKLIKNSEYFDPEFYKSVNNDLSVENLNPFWHYFQNGINENRTISKKFTLARTQSGNYNQTLIDWERYEKHLEKIKKDKIGRQLATEAENTSMLPIETIKKIIDDDNIKIVSFDIFDTLLYRPVLSPDDIFKFMDKILEDKQGVKDFYEKRNSIEPESKDWLANLDEIYEYMRIKYSIPYAQIVIMKDLEIEIESRLLSPRKEIFDLYNIALEKDKKVIAISDMYMSSAFLKKILHDKGYHAISDIYVSNECGCVKGSGLFDHMLKNEKTDPNNIVHIGDNIVSDYYCAQNSGICGIYYPCAKNLILRNTKIGKDFIPSNYDVYARMIMGYIFNHAAGRFNNDNHIKKHFTNFEEIIAIGYFPIILSIALYILNSKKIQHGYGKVFFASRDGYQPMQVYNILSDKVKSLPSKYIYAGRRAYNFLLSETIYDYLQYSKKYIDGAQQKDSFKKLLEVVIDDRNITDKIISENNIDSEMKFPSALKLYRIIKPYEGILNNWFMEKKKASSEYYKCIMNTTDDREVIYDCGFSGTISEFISPVIGKPLDKIYLFSLNKNYELDKKNGTITYQILCNDQIPPLWASISYEELFSPLQGSCTGFHNGIPVLEDLEFPKSMRHKYALIDQTVKDMATEFADIFGSLLKYFILSDFKSLQSIILAALIDPSNDCIGYFEDICFPDPLSNQDYPTLADKLSEKLCYPDVFTGTAMNSEHMLKLTQNSQLENLKIGIHLHLYDFFTWQEFARYLSCFPYKYDLYITYPDESGAINYPRHLMRYFSRQNQLVLLPVPNRGRDVAPWLMMINKYHGDYDLFCHVHSKASGYCHFGSRWRQYLLRNLLEKQAVATIIAAFRDDGELGCVFPPPFPELKDEWIRHEVKPFGDYNERENIKELLKRMNIDVPFVRKDLIFSLGTMLWYRPEALRQLFEMELSLAEFTQEPRFIGGNLDQAIERLPAFVCKFNGYKARMYALEDN